MAHAILSTFLKREIIHHSSSWLQVCHPPQESMLGSGSLSATSASHTYASPALSTLGKKHGVPPKSWGSVDASGLTAEFPAVVSGRWSERRRERCSTTVALRRKKEEGLPAESIQRGANERRGEGWRVSVFQDGRKENWRINLRVLRRRFTPATTETMCWIKGDSGLVCWAEG